MYRLECRKDHGWGGYMKAGSWNPDYSPGFPYMQISNPNISLSQAKEDMKNVTAFLKANSYTCPNGIKRPSCNELEPVTYDSWYDPRLTLL